VNYSVRVNNVSGSYFYIGYSPLYLEQLVEQVEQGKFIKLDDLFWGENGNVQKISAVYINPKAIIAVEQIKDNPQNLPR